MSIRQQRQLVKLEEAITICRKQDRLCMWLVDGELIKLDFKIPPAYIFAKLSVVVDSKNSCRLIAICISPLKKKNRLIDVGSFSSLENLKEKYPPLFELRGTFDYL